MAISEEHLRRAVDDVLEPAWPWEYQRVARRLVSSTLGRLAGAFLALWVLALVVYLLTSVSKRRKMRTKLIFSGFLMFMSLSLASPAFADSTCYTGCTPPPIQQVQSSVPAAPASHATSSTPLPFTGADVIELLVIAVIALGAGGTLLALKRRRSAQPTPRA